MKKTFFAFALQFTFFICCLSHAQAYTAGFAVKPALVQRLLKIAQVPVKLVENSPDSPFPCSVYIPELQGSSVTIGFPASGIWRQTPFYLEIDGAAATVIITDHGGLAIVEGDRRITASCISCIFSAIITMIDDFFYALFHLDFIGMISAIFNGIRWIFNCIFGIFI